MSLPPGPESSPLLQSVQYRFRPFEFLEECERRYGDLFTLRFPIIGPLVCASRPETVRRIFAAGTDELRLGEANQIFRPISGERSITVLDGPEHLRLRRLSLPLFHAESPSRSEMVLAVTQRRVDGWSEGQRVQLREEMEVLLLEVTLRMLFGLNDLPGLEELSGGARTMVKWSASPAGALLMVPALQRDLPLLPWRGFKRDLAALRAQVKALTELRRSEGELVRRQDVLSQLLVAREQGALDEEELLDLILMLIFAGYETAATSLCWAFETILAHPRERAWLDEELEAVTSGESLRVEHLPRLKRLEAAIKEVLRLYPVVPILGMARQAMRPFEVQGLTLPAGTKLAPISYLTQRRDDTYADASRFCPARFLERSPAPWEWLPFGGGVRRCVGLPFALHELRVVLACILGRTRMRLVAPAPSQGELDGVTVGPKGGAWVTVETVLPRRRQALAPSGQRKRI